MNNIARNYIIILIAGGWLLVLYSLFTFTLNADNNGTATDEASNTQYSIENVENNTSPNPHAPAFVGFDVLTEKGVSDDDVRYIQDYVSVFTVQNQKKSRALVSYVADSFNGPIPNGTSSEYRFSFAINNAARYTLNVTTDIVTEKIKLQISDSQSNDAEPISSKEFILLAL